MPILSPTDHQFWDENGYIIVKQAVPSENLTAVIEAMWQFLDMDPNNPDDWYSQPPGRL